MRSHDRHGQRLALGVGIALVGGIVAWWFMSRARDDQTEKIALVDHTYQVRKFIGTTSRAVLQWELATEGGGALAHPFEVMKGRSDTLRALVSDNPTQSARADTIGALIARLPGHVADAAARHRDEGRIALVVDSMAGEEDRLFRERHDRVLSGDVRRTQVVDALSAFTLVIVIAVAGLLAWSDQLRRRAEVRFQRVAETAPIGIGVFDHRRRALYTNPAFTRLTGITPASPVAQTQGQRLHPEDRARVMQVWEEFTEGRAEFDITSRLTVDGTEYRAVHFVAQAVSKAVSDGGDYVVTVSDVSALESARRDLEQQRDDLARSNADLEHFAYVASHDLQEPLRMIGSFTTLLADRYRGRLDSDADEFIGFVTDGVSRMQQLIRDLLEYSRVHVDAERLRDVAMAGVVDDVLGLLGPTIRDTGATIRVEGELPAVHVDRVLIVQLLRNLVANALKFRSAAAPEIVIAASERDGEIRFSVRDNGIGIAPEFHDVVFLLFRRLHARSAYPGSGMGLALCRRIVEHHGGRIWIDPDVVTGTTVNFTLPSGKES